MRNNLIKSIFLLVIFWSTGISSFAQNNVKVINGKSFYIHEVKPGETLYGLTNKYNVTTQLILENNPEVKEGLKVGQELKIPVTKTSAPSDNIHIVQPGETLFSLSRDFNISVTEIKQLNNLQSDNLTVGQKLIVKKGTTITNEIPKEIKTEIKEEIKEEEPKKLPQGKVHEVKAGETLFSISRLYNIHVDELIELNDLTDNTLSIGQVLKLSALGETNIVKKEEEVIKEEKQEIKNTVTVKKEEEQEQATQVVKKEEPENREKELSKFKEPTSRTKDFVEIEETGVAELIEGTQNSRKYL
ncbi:MAG: LysM peptidoglycan-binding domain-containing protein, partial [Cyclobacteriaceae bacterium]|nr:LysM peptidoglycan-binding domain-containing protein [Cyclobacteriaceae bacterium]